MIVPSLALLLAVKAVAHWGAVHHADKPLFYPIVEVHNCAGGILDIYSDKNLTDPLINPIVGDQNGFYSYYAKTPYVRETILFGEETITKNTCPIRSPENGQH